VEVTLLKAIESRNAVSLDSVLRQLNQLRSQGGAGSPAVAKHNEGGQTAAPAIHFPIAAPAAKAPAKNHVHHPVAAAPAALAETPSGTADLGGLWLQLIEAVGRVSQFTRTYLREAHPVSFAQGILTIGFDPEFEDHISLVDNSRNHTLIQTKLAELGHANVQVKFIKDEAPVGQTAKPAAPKPAAPAPSKTVSQTSAPPKPGEGESLASGKEKPAPVAFNKDNFKNDPLIKKALEIFKGQIIEVRA
jgi:hypothetical protein